MSDVDILIPTLHRPESLTRALRSVFAQTALDTVDRIVVVDNSPEASARETVDALRAASPVPLCFVHAAAPGVATARNAGLAASDAAYVAFLDDDEEAPPHWLESLRTTHLALGADVTFGPVRGVAPTPQAWKRGYLDRFFSRTGPAESGVSTITHGCGNSMMTRATALAGPAPFETAADETGGEDDRLFSRLKTLGGLFGWAAEAWVFEHAPPHRARLRYALHRAFAYGQGPSYTCALNGDWPGVAKWMLVGAGQTLLFAPLAAILWLVRSPYSADAADRAAKGLGKVFWRMRQNFYGQAEARRATRANVREGTGTTARTAAA